MSPVRVIPLGGTGEIGKNLYTVEYENRIVLIDCGLTFPGREQLGVDLVLPDFAYLEEHRDKVEAVLLTHGHEDHIGALPYLLRAIGQVPVYGGRFTLGLVRSKLDEHRLADAAELIEVAPGEVVQVGPFETEFVRLAHSIPDCMAIVLNTPDGAILHTGDFKFDHQPIGSERPDIPGLSRMGDRGVLLLLADSTNAERAGVIRPERTVGEELRRLMALAPGRVILTTFSSHIHRVQQALDAAYEDGRGVALVGRSLNRNTNIATTLGYLKAPPNTLLKPRELDQLAADEQVIICTGSQGEPLAALSRMARGEHQQVQIEPTDTIIYSSRTVPGNELAVNEIINRIVRIGARVITEESNPGVHVSGHGSAADLMLMLQLVRPRFFAPIHGEARHQRAHADLAMANGIPAERIFILDNGDVLDVDAERGEITGQVEVGITYVDRMGGADIGEAILRDRRHLAEDGLVLVVATVGAHDGALMDVEIVTRGFAAGDDPELMEQTRLEVERSLAASAEQRVTEVGVLQHQLHDAVAALLKKRTQQRPMVMPVIVEV